MTHKVRFTISSVLVAVATFIVTHFQILPKDQTGEWILALIVYVFTAITHSAGTVATTKPTGISRLAPLLLLPVALGGLPTPMQAQGGRAAIVAAAESLPRHIELGVDAVMRSDSVTQPRSLRAGLVLGQNFTLEVQSSAERSSEGYFEATANLGVTAAILPSSTNLAGEYVMPLVSYHYDGGPAQLGVGFETGTRDVLSASGFSARASMFTITYFKTASLPAITSVGARVGLSFWR